MKQPRQRKPKSVSGISTNRKCIKCTKSSNQRALQKQVAKRTKAIKRKR